MTFVPNSFAALVPVQQSETLESLIEDARSKNLELMTAEFEAKRYSSRIDLAVNLDDSLLAYYYLGFPARILREATPSATAPEGTPETRTAKNTIRGRARFERSAFMIKEMTKNNAAWYQALRDDLYLQIVRQIREDYYQLYFQDRIIATTEKTLSTLNKLLDISEERYAVGDLTQKDVFQVQAEKSLILIQLLELRQERVALATNLNYLAGRDTTAPLSPTLGIDLSHTELKKISRTIPELTAYMALNRPLVKGYRSLAKTFDIMQLMIPMYFNRILRRDGLLEVESGMRAIKTELADFKSKVTAELVTEHSQLLKYLEQARLYGNALLPQIRQVLAANQADFLVGQTDLRTPLQTLITLNEYQIDYYQALANHQKSLAKLEAASAMSLF